MGKLAPEELWRRHTLEQLEAFRQSSELKKLQKEGLAACSRKKRFTAYEWATSPMSQRYLSTQYMKWYHKCETIGRRFGLATHTVVAICLISGYQPEKELFVIESNWPRIRLVTEQTNPLFLAWLSYEAHQLGLYVIQRCGSTEVTLAPPNFPPPEALPATEQPPRDDAFFTRVETPPRYPPQASANLEKRVKQLEKELFRRLGYPVTKRLRYSRLTSMAGDLRITEARLPKRGLYEIVADTYDWGSVSEDEQKRRTVKTQRHRLRKRLVKPYEAS